MTSTEELEQRIRHSLRTVAETVTETAHAPTKRRSRWRWTIGLGIGAVAIPIAFAASTYVQRGPEYVDTIPPEDIVATGSAGGSSYLLVESSRMSECGPPVTGLELVEEKENLLGSEWNTTGLEYGELDEQGCDTTDRYLADPALFNDGGTEVGDSLVWTWSVHPDVTAVRITADGFSEDLPVLRYGGAGYALFEIPEDMREYTAELLIDGVVVPGSVEEHLVRDRD
jgi:hypothetical protein